MQKIGLEYICFLNQSGYSQSAQDNILSLSNSNDYDLSIKVFGNNPSRPSVSDTRYSVFSKLLNKNIDNPIQIYHCIPNIQRRVEKKNRNIGFATFETLDPPDDWVNILNKNDAIITPSKFNYEIFAHKQIKKPLYYIPHCIDFNLYNDKVKPMYSYDKFTFLFLGTWKVRKGYQTLIESWFSEFSDKDKVQLVIKTDKPKKAQNYIENVKKEMGISKGFAPIFIENKIFSDTELPSFIKSFDCLVIPTKGEGFCLPGLQSMALKVPVIITNYSGCLDYANEETAYLLHHRGFILHKNMDNIPQFRNKKWAFLAVKDVQEKMRYVCNNYEDSKVRVNKAYKYVRERFNYEIVKEKFTQMIRELYG